MIWFGLVIDINADFAGEISHTNLVSEELLNLGLSTSWDNYDVEKVTSDIVKKATKKL